MGEAQGREDERCSKQIAASKVQISVYVSSEIAEAARNAVIATTSYSKGYRSLSELVSDALAEKVARLEKQFNNGRPFPHREHELRAGRPLA